MTENRKYTYCGPVLPPQQVNNHEAALSAENAMLVIQTAWAGGRTHVGTHFKKRCSERSIDMIDVENVVRNGTVNGIPEYSPDYKTWKYRVTAATDDRNLELVIALDSNEDYEASPLVILVTAYEKTPTIKP